MGVGGWSRDRGVRTVTPRVGGWQGLPLEASQGLPVLGSSPGKVTSVCVLSSGPLCPYLQMEGDGSCFYGCVPLSLAFRFIFAQLFYFFATGAGTRRGVGDPRVPVLKGAFLRSVMAAGSRAALAMTAAALGSRGDASQGLRAASSLRDVGRSLAMRRVWPEGAIGAGPGGRHHARGPPGDFGSPRRRVRDREWECLRAGGPLLGVGGQPCRPVPAALSAGRESGRGCPVSVARLKQPLAWAAGSRGPEPRQDKQPTWL